MKNNLKDILFDLFDSYENVEDIIESLRSLESENEITEEEYDEIMINFDLWLKEYEQQEESKSLCFMCGNKKEDYESSYCDKCWDEEKMEMDL